MKKIIFSLFVVLTLLMGVNLELKSQTPPDCDTTGCGWTIIGDGLRDVIVSPGCILRVQWETRECPPNPREFRILSWTLIGENCGNYSASALKELALFGILDGYGGPIPDCGFGSPVITVNIYVGICVYEQVCTYTYTVAPTVVCDPLNSDPPEPLSLTRTVRRHLPCGSICCKTTFEICRFTPVMDGVPQPPYKRVRKVGSSVPLGVCDPAPPLSSGPCIPICNQ